MRILMINNEFPPLGGGTATANWMVFRELAKRPEVRIDLVTAAAGKSREETAFSDNIRLIRLPVGIRDIHHAGARELLTFAFRARREAASLHRANPYDVALAWHAIPAAIPLLPLRWFHRLPYLIRVGGADIPGFEKRYARLYPFLKPILRTLWKFSAGVIVKSEGERDMLRKSRASLETLLIPNGVDTEMFFPSATPHETNRPLRVLCVARLIERKGQDHLIRAVASVPGMELFLAGGGDSRPAFEHLAQGLGVLDRVHFLGEIDRSDLPDLYRQADIFAMTSYNEGMSNAMLEAMASGLPVLVTRTAGTDELVEENSNGWTLNPGDEIALEERFRHILKNRERLTEMGKAAREKASQFSWKTSALKYLQALQAAR